MCLLSIFKRTALLQFSNFSSNIFYYNSTSMKNNKVVKRFCGLHHTFIISDISVQSILYLISCPYTVTLNIHLIFFLLSYTTCIGSFNISILSMISYLCLNQAHIFFLERFLNTSGIAQSPQPLCSNFLLINFS